MNCFNKFTIGLIIIFIPAFHIGVLLSILNLEYWLVLVITFSYAISSVSIVFWYESYCSKKSELSNTNESECST